MPVTSPDSISYPDTSYTSGIVAAMAAQATSVQTALSTRAIKAYRWADSAARAAQTGMAAGDVGFQIDTGVDWRYSGTSWLPTVYMSTFTSATTVTLDDLSAEFRLLEVDYWSAGTAANASVTLRTTGGSDVATNYDYTSSVFRNGTTASSTSVAQTSWFLNGYSNTINQGTIKFAGLGQAIETTALAFGATHADPAIQNTANGFSTSYFTHRDATAYGGFKITFSAAQTGYVRVRGLL